MKVALPLLYTDDVSLALLQTLEKPPVIEPQLAAFNKPASYLRAGAES
ncbi:hypothetical protein LZV00_03805 [Pseudomonas kielensis]|nr:hypothetical protein [Pseudomonas kielensis]UZM14923.1 hypothetical protein LZV00_03805 [Pseudomonas kielensis]